MPESSKIISSYLQILKKRGIKSLFNEIKDNYFFDFFHNVETQMREGKSNKYFHHYAPIYFSVLNEALSTFRNYEKLNFIDVGCGKGKGILIASNFNFKKIIGVEINKHVYKVCKQNLKNYNNTKNKKNIQLVNGNALNYNVTDENIFFFFDPFSEKILNEFLKKIILSFKNRRRSIYLIYANPPKKNIYLNKNFKIIKEIKRSTYNCYVYKVKY